MKVKEYFYNITISYSRKRFLLFEGKTVHFSQNGIFADYQNWDINQIFYKILDIAKKECRIDNKNFAVTSFFIIENRNRK